jgi:hypothetical protein
MTVETKENSVVVPMIRDKETKRMVRFAPIDSGALEETPIGMLYVGKSVCGEAKSITVTVTIN